MSQHINSRSGSTIDFVAISDSIRDWALDLGFQDVGFCDVALGEHEAHLFTWLENGFQGDMHYMSQHGTKRTRPDELVPGTVRAIVVRMDYLPVEPNVVETLADGDKAYVSRYALGRDYHKVIRARLRKLELKIGAHLETLGIEGFQARVFTDSAPVLEKALAENAGLGWIGKNTLLMSRHAGSWFFLGEILTNLPLPVSDEPMRNHCGSCSACIEVCPTNAFVGPYQLDARRCISYLTIEKRGTIDVEFREAMGNRVFGCDDCQQFCPWNRYASPTSEPDFAPRHQLHDIELLALFGWDEETFLERTQGSPIRRTGYAGWQRNLSIGLGNAAYNPDIVSALEQSRDATDDPVLTEHFTWALTQQRLKKNGVIAKH